MKKRYIEIINGELEDYVLDTIKDEEYMTTEAVELLNKYYELILDIEDRLRQLNGRKLFNLEHIEVSDILNKITEIKQWTYQ